MALSLRSLRMATGSSPKNCGVCQEEYNIAERAPRVLPCSHTLCNSCIDHLIRYDNKLCPFCREGFAGNIARQFKLSYTTLDLLKQNAENKRPKMRSIPLAALKVHNTGATQTLDLLKRNAKNERPKMLSIPLAALKIHNTRATQTSSKARTTGATQTITTNWVNDVKAEVKETSNKHIIQCEATRIQMEEIVTSVLALRDGIKTETTRLEENLLPKMEIVRKQNKSKEKELDAMHQRLQSHQKEIDEMDTVLKATNKKIDESTANTLKESAKLLDEAMKINASTQIWFDKMEEITEKEAVGSATEKLRRRTSIFDTIQEMLNSEDFRNNAVDTDFDIEDATEPTICIRREKRKRLYIIIFLVFFTLFGFFLRPLCISLVMFLVLQMLFLIVLFLHSLFCSRYFSLERTFKEFKGSFGEKYAALRGGQNPERVETVDI